MQDTPTPFKSAHLLFQITKHTCYKIEMVSWWEFICIEEFPIVA
jgi:hypothetical protein